MLAQLQDRFFDILAGRNPDIKSERLVQLLHDVNRLKSDSPSVAINNFTVTIEMAIKADRWLIE